MATRILVCFASVAAALAQTSAQLSTQSAPGGTSSFSGTASFGPSFPMGPAVTGAPYSGEEVNESVQILADGTRITRKNMGRRVWRDTQGRTRSERPLAMGPNPAATQNMPVIIEIVDPVAGFKYTLDTQRKVAHRQKLPAMPGQGVTFGPTGGVTAYRGAMTLPPPQGATSGGGGGGASGGFITTASAPAQMDPQLRPKFSTEKIGTQTIDGMLAEGTRQTVTYPVGMMGNDREFTSASESWMSTELKIQILSKSTDPRSGESTFRIANLSRTPPDPLLFMAPADYTIVDETGPFTIRWGNTAQ